MSGHSPKEGPLSPAKLANQIRFETELEFVQCLANPHYLASLATQGLLAQPNFIAYLKYLTYWLDVDKGFGRFIVYPHALHHLALLQQPSFREALKDPELRMRLEREQYEHWRTWRTVERNIVPINGHIHPSVEDTDAPTPNPSRVSRRSGTARSSGARTPAGRTPRTIRTPGTVRTPGFGASVRTPAPRSALSVSMTMKDHLAEVGLPIPGAPISDAAMAASPVVEDPHQRMVMDSPLDSILNAREGNSNANGAAAPSSGTNTSVPATSMDVDKTEPA